jgi:AraC-like DNA-binding protein
MFKQCKDQKSMVVYDCYAGPTEAIFPVKLERTIIGYVIVGAFRTRKRLPNEIITQWTKKGFKTETITEAFNEMPFYDRTSMYSMLKHFSALIKLAVNENHVRTHSPVLTEQVSKWLDDNIAKPVTLDDVAATLGRSKSAITHNLTQKLGLSFKQLLIHKRIERFQSLIASNPEMTIQEASLAVGYEDSAYFSRLYKKARHVPPSVYVSTMRNSD